MGKLVIDHLVKKFEDVTAVNHVSFTVEDGEFLTVVGPSGCGKTTLLRMIAGFTEPTHGSIRIDDDVLFDSDKHMHAVAPENRGIGMVFQTYAVWPHMNAYNNVAYPLKIRKVPKAEIRTRVAEALRLVHLTGYEKRMAFEMSGGQQQRVALARALVGNPRVLLLDEPFSNLDAVLREEMSAEVKEIQKKLGITVIHVTHDQKEAMAMSDRIAVMKDGNLIQLATPQKIYNRPACTFVAGFIGSANIVPALKNPSGRPDSEGMMSVTLPGDAELRVPYVRSDITEGYVTFRSHQVRFDQEGMITAEVKGSQYHGNSITYIMKLADGTRIKMLTGASERYEIGQMIPLTAEDAVWLDE